MSCLFTLCPSYESSVRVGPGSGLFMAVPSAKHCAWHAKCSINAAEQSSRHDLLLSEETLLPGIWSPLWVGWGRWLSSLPGFPALQAGLMRLPGLCLHSVRVETREMISKMENLGCAHLASAFLVPTLSWIHSIQSLGPTLGGVPGPARENQTKRPITKWHGMCRAELGSHLGENHVVLHSLEASLHCSAWASNLSFLMNMWDNPDS